MDCMHSSETKAQHETGEGDVGSFLFGLPAPLQVLLAEEDDSTRQVVTSLLRNCGYEVTSVSAGQDVWHILQDPSIQIDLVLIEVLLPTVSGLDLLHIIMDHTTLKCIPVVIMSSHDSMGLILKCLSLGAADFLIKPVRKNELKNIWQHVWRKNGSSAGYMSRTRDVAVNMLPATRCLDDEPGCPYPCTACSEGDCGSGTQSSRNSGNLQKDAGNFQNIMQENQSANADGGDVERNNTVDLFGAIDPDNKYDQEISSQKEPACTVTLDLFFKKGLELDHVGGNIGLRYSESSAFSRYTGRRAIEASTSHDDKHLHPTGNVHLESISRVAGASSWQKGVALNPPWPTWHAEMLHKAPVGQDGSLENVHSSVMCSVPMATPFSAYQAMPHAFYGPHLYHLQHPPFVAQQGTNDGIVSFKARMENRKLNATVGSEVLKVEETDPSASRKAALLRFQRKRHERCFEKKVRYQSRKMLAEQRPRQRGQFVKRVAQ